MRSKLAFSFSAFFLILLFLSFREIKNDSGTANPFTRSLEEMGPAIVKALSKNDSASYFLLFINEAEFTEVINSSLLDAEKKNSVLANLKKGKFEAEAKFSWRQLQAKIIKVGLTWKDITGEKNEISTETEQGVTSGFFRYTFKTNGKLYAVYNSLVIKTANGWKLNSRIRFKDLNEEFTQMEIARQMAFRDSLLADSVMKADIAEMQFREMDQRLRDSLAADSLSKARKNKKRRN